MGGNKIDFSQIFTAYLKTIKNQSKEASMFFEELQKEIDKMKNSIQKLKRIMTKLERSLDEEQKGK